MGGVSIGVSDELIHNGYQNTIIPMEKFEEDSISELLQR
jgi:hypothetical protein